MGIYLYSGSGFPLLKVCEIYSGFSTSYPQGDAIRMARILQAIVYPGRNENSGRVGNLVF